ncbi:MAG: hypothetical protein KAS32_23085 [Candidatus Peribacteraceae bacterium]|nr:hypothetical protein [Candidatus Peribacteraceae bacterium]
MISNVNEANLMDVLEGAEQDIRSVMDLSDEQYMIGVGRPLEQKILAINAVLLELIKFTLQENERIKDEIRQI